MTVAKLHNRGQTTRRRSLKSKFKIAKNEKANGLIEIRPSGIPQAGLGAFAKSKIREKTTLGEYKGKLMTKKQYDDLDDSKCSYIFQINKKVAKTNKRRDVFIDARFKKHSNWTRFVNGAKSREQQDGVNIEAYQYGGKLFYRTTQEVNAGDELLVDYGSDYWTSDEEEEEDFSEEEEEEQRQQSENEKEEEDDQNATEEEKFSED